MNQAKLARVIAALPWLAGLAGVFILGFWLGSRPAQPLSLREPGADRPAGSREIIGAANPVLSGTLLPGEGQATNGPGLWPQFRGPNRDGISPEKTALARAWDPTGPPLLWTIEMGEGFAGPVIAQGRIYLMDYDHQKKQDALRCLSLMDGREIWRFAYPMVVKRNHGMSRTVPAVSGNYVVAMGPKCHVVCLEAATGQLRWGLDLVRQFDTVTPPWYAGQCVLVEDGAVILAPGGKDALLMAVDCETGQVRWRTPNPAAWRMTHSSIMPMYFSGAHQYLYCASLGVVGVSATDGKELWRTRDWKISFANVPSPVVLEEGKIFLTGGYNAGSLMLQLQEAGGQIKVAKLFKLEPEVFAATQHTPIYYNQHLFGVRADGQFVCLDLNGKVRWTSTPKHQFGLGPFLLADGLCFVLSETGKLSLIEANPDQFNLLAQAQVFKGHEAWGPMALAGGKLLLRDLTHLFCLDVEKK